MVVRLPYRQCQPVATAISRCPVMAQSHAAPLSFHYTKTQVYSQSFQMLVLGERLRMDALQGVVRENAGTSRSRNYVQLVFN
jgi:hypothetical protein